MTDNTRLLALHNLVDITHIDPRIKLDIRYATPHNIGRTALYPRAVCYLHKDAAQALKGKELAMPSEFDDFTQRAHRDNPAHSAQARANMLMLEKAMESAGFAGWPLEWWHYDLQDWNDDAQYPPLDIPLV